MTQDQFTTFVAIARKNYGKSAGWTAFSESYHHDDIARFFAKHDVQGEQATEQAMMALAKVWDDATASRAEIFRHKF